MSQDLAPLHTCPIEDWRRILLHEAIDQMAERYVAEIHAMAISARRSLGQSLRWGSRQFTRENV